MGLWHLRPPQISTDQKSVAAETADQANTVLGNHQESWRVYRDVFWRPFSQCVRLVGIFYVGTSMIGSFPTMPQRPLWFIDRVLVIYLFAVVMRDLRSYFVD
jgi:hypothetical protein